MRSLRWPFCMLLIHEFTLFSIENSYPNFFILNVKVSLIVGLLRLHRILFILIVIQTRVDFKQVGNRNCKPYKMVIKNDLLLFRPHLVRLHYSVTHIFHYRTIVASCFELNVFFECIIMCKCKFKSSASCRVNLKRR